MRLFIVLIALVLAAPGAEANAWLREHRGGFLSTGGAMRWTGSGAVAMESTIYAEYGLRPELTLGLDLSLKDDGTGAAAIFARVAAFDQGNVTAAFDAGLGARQDPGGPVPFVSGGLSVGTDWRTARGPGWAVARVSARYSPEEPARFKLDATIGQTVRPRMKLLFGVELAQSGGRSAAVVPGIAYALRDGRSIYAGLEARRAPGITSYGLRAGLWHQF